MRCSELGRCEPDGTSRETLPLNYGIEDDAREIKHLRLRELAETVDREPYHPIIQSERLYQTPFHEMVIDVLTQGIGQRLNEASRRDLRRRVETRNHRSDVNLHDENSLA
jgi:hypothetical protein